MTVPATLFGAAFAVLALAAPAVAQPMTLTGDMAYRERIALPDNAVASVALIDVSLADAPSTTIAEQVIDPAGQVPIGFVLTFQADDIVAGHTYAIAARIEVDDELWFLNDERLTLDPLNHTDVIAVPLVSARGKNVDAGDGGDAGPWALAGTRWTLATLAGEPVAEDVETSFNIDAEGGAVGGTGGCNSYGGTLTRQADGTIAMTDIVSTLMACPGAAMDQERGFFDALMATTDYEIVETMLVLFDEEGNSLAELAAAED